MAWLSPIQLKGQEASLVPLDSNHRAELSLAVQDGNLWELWYTSVPEPDGVAAEIQRRLELQGEGKMLPFTVLDRDEKPVGMTTYMNLDPETKRLEIGSTWYATSVQRTGINSECKLMLLAHAFEQLECVAVEFRTSFFNQQSRTAIERLGAKLDGILRSHTRHRDGTLRDTCVYSILPQEWPTVQQHLVQRLERNRRRS